VFPTEPLKCLRKGCCKERTLSPSEYSAFSIFPSILKASKHLGESVLMKNTKTDTCAFDCLMEEEND